QCPARLVGTGHLVPGVFPAADRPLFQYPPVCSRERQLSAGEALEAGSALLPLCPSYAPNPAAGRAVPALRVAVCSAAGHWPDGGLVVPAGGFCWSGRGGGGAANRDFPLDPPGTFPGAAPDDADCRAWGE